MTSVTLTLQIIIINIVLLFSSQCYSEFITFEHGGRENKLFVPSSYNKSNSQGYPLFVMLHGCTQDPEDFAVGSKMNTYGEQYKFLVLYPLQPKSENFNKCWNWYYLEHQHRDSGEPAFIASATQAVMKSYNVDKKSVICAGLSAGGGMASIMGAAYPDLYTSLGMIAGTPYKSAFSIFGVLKLTIFGPTFAEEKPATIYEFAKDHIKHPMKVFVAHGSNDWISNYKNAMQITQQWVFTNNFYYGSGKLSQQILRTPSDFHLREVEGGHKYTEYEYSHSGTGEVFVKNWKIHGMGHGYPGGDPKGTYVDPLGPDVSLFMVKWFLGLDPSITHINLKCNAENNEGCQD